MSAIQTRFPGKVEKPWAGVCCEACWNARGKRCTCRCGGLYHGIGHGLARRKDSEPTLHAEATRKIVDAIKDKRCRWCGAEMGPPVYCYEHSAGWPMKGYEKLLWLYLKCPKCGYDWALWKLGISRGASFE